MSKRKRRKVSRLAVKRRRHRVTLAEVERRSEVGSWAGGCRACGHVVDNVRPDAPRARCPSCGLFAFDAYDDWALGPPGLPPVIPQ